MEGEENLHEMAKETLKKLGISQAQMARELGNRFRFKIQPEEPARSPSKWLPNPLSLITTPPRPRRWQGIRLFPFHGTKRTCSLAGGGAVPHKPSFASSTACLKNVLFALAQKGSRQKMPSEAEIENMQQMGLAQIYEDGNGLQRLGLTPAGWLLAENIPQVMCPQPPALILN